MSNLNNYITIVKSVIRARNPISHLYHRLFHNMISRNLARQGVSHVKYVKIFCNNNNNNIRYVCKKDQQAIISIAEKTLNNVFNVLGSGDVLMNPVKWSTDFISGYEWKAGVYYKKYVQVDLQRHVDVKVPRELSRFHFLLHLALAYRFTGENKYVKKGEELITDWIEKNPLMYSINWGCAMDVAIRAVNWIWALSLIGRDELSNEFEEKVIGSLYQHGWYIYRNLEGNRFRYNNNHYYSDLVGLLHISALYKGDKEADEWFDFALKEFYHETRLQILPSGMDYEGSTNYHRLVTELLVTTISFLRRIGEEVPIDITSRCENMFDLIYKLMMPDGTMPIVGDQDNGRCLPWGVEDINDYSYLMSLGAALFNRGDFKAKGNGFNIYCTLFCENGSYNSFQKLNNTTINIQSQMLRDSGYALMRNDRNYMLFYVDNQGKYIDERTSSSHTHSDWFSFVLCIEGVPFFIDPGTHVYSQDAESRNLFRSTQMHNTVVVDGQNQSEVFDKKLWDIKRTGKVIGVRWESDDTKDFISCAHTGYEILSSPVRHQRSILFDKVAGNWTIEDLLTSEGTHTYEVHFHLADNVTAIVNDKTCVLERNGVRIQMSFDSEAEICIKISNTFLSESYGHKAQGIEVIVSLKEESMKLVTNIIKC